MVQNLEEPFVVAGFRMGLHCSEDGGVGPRLIAEEGTKQVDHGAMILPEIRDRIKSATEPIQTFPAEQNGRHQPPK
jgi:hypothetical protein